MNQESFLPNLITLFKSEGTSDWAFPDDHTAAWLTYLVKEWKKVNEFTVPE